MKRVRVRRRVKCGSARGCLGGGGGGGRRVVEFRTRGREHRVVMLVSIRNERSSDKTLQIEMFHLQKSIFARTEFALAKSYHNDSKSTFRRM